MSVRAAAAASARGRNGPFLFPGPPRGGRLGAGGRRLAERALGLSALQACYDALPGPVDNRDFPTRALDGLGIERRHDPAAGTRIPAAGGLLVVANHPFGGLDGLAALEVLLARRADVRVLANHFLARIPELAPFVLPVDVFGGRAARHYNARALRAAAAWLRKGGALLVFPAGEVAHLRPREGRVSDPPWRAGIARLARHSPAVLPLFIEGRNSVLFQAAGLVHPTLRSLLLGRELLARRGSPLRLHIGEAIPNKALPANLAPADLAHYLRSRTYLLSPRRPGPGRSTPAAHTPPAPRKLADPTPASLLAAEVAALPAGCLLGRSGALDVYLTEAVSIPWVLQEIGRLRELSFRAVGEGTGHASDLALCDAYYRHLFLWNRTRREVVGAYRLGDVEEIVRRYGKRGLYSFSLFHYDARLLARLRPALELGRSFVRPEYQRGYAPLMLLWRGIGAFIAANPRYRYLFGPVSISAGYDPQSRQLMVDFLRATAFEDGLGRHVRARTPMQGRALPLALSRGLAGRLDLDGLSALIGQIEPDHKGVPVLLRQYLKLGGRLIGFNVDQAFNDALDALVVVDLYRGDRRLLARYLGEAGVAALHEAHGGARGFPRAV